MSVRRDRKMGRASRCEATPVGRRLVDGLAVVCVLLAGCGGPTAIEPTDPLLHFVSGGGATDTIEAALATPLVVEVLDSLARPAVGVQVVLHGVTPGLDPNALGEIHPPYLHFSGSDYVPSITATTDSKGQVAVGVRLGEVAGTSFVVAEVGAFGLRDSTTFITLAGNAVKLTVSPADTVIYVGHQYSLTASAVDRWKNPISGSLSFQSLTATTISVANDGRVTASSVGRGAIEIQTPPLSAHASVSVVPEGTFAFFDHSGARGSPIGYARANLDGSGYQWIAQVDTSTGVYSPGRSPAPQWIPGTDGFVYTVTVDRASRIVADDGKGSPRRLVDRADITSEMQPAVSPDGAWVYFTGTGPDLETQQLWRVSLGDGTLETLTTREEGRFFLSPTLSPDGSRMAYVSSPDCGVKFHIFIKDLSTGDTRQVTSNEAAGTAWSPTGEWILYAVSGQYFSGQMRIVRPDGSDDRPLTDGAFYPVGTWSPDGAYVIAYRANIESSGLKLITVADGTALPLSYRTADWLAPSWRR